MSEDFPSNPELLRAIELAAESDSADARLDFYSRLLESRLLVPVAGPPEPDGSVGLLVMQGPEGQTGVPAFTDREALDAWNKDCRGAIALNAAVVFQMVRASGHAAVLLNPAGPVGGQIDGPEFEALAEGRVPRPGEPPVTTVPAGTGFDIGPIENRPEESVLRRLGETMAGRSEVSSAYLFMMSVGGRPAQFVIGLEVPTPLPKEAFGELMSDLMARLNPLLGSLGDVQGCILKGPMLVAAKKAGLPLLVR